MSSTISGITQWQTWRVVTAEDTLLTDYKPADLTAAVRAKTISVHPATAIAVRFMGKDTANDTAVIHIHGFMDPDKPGCGAGVRLYHGTVTLGARSIASFQPLTDGRWGAAATWFEPDTIAATADFCGATELTSTDREAMLLLPTLGFTNLLLEVRDIGGGGTEMTAIGAMYRAIRMGEVFQTF